MVSAAFKAATTAGGRRFNLLLSRTVLLWSLFAYYADVAAANILENSAVVTVEAVAAMLMGATVCLAGYRFLSATAFACGFLFGGVATAYATMSFVSPNASIPVGGVTAAALCLLSRRIGGSIVGACGGFAIAYVVYALAGEKLSPADPSRALLGLTAAFGVAGAVAVLKFQETALIVTSSVSGASLALLGMAHFIKSFPDPAGLTAFRLQDRSEPWLSAVPRAWWSYLLMLVAYSAIGTHVQLQTAAKAEDSVGPSDRPSPPNIQPTDEEGPMFIRIERG